MEQSVPGTYTGIPSQFTYIAKPSCDIKECMGISEMVVKCIKTQLIKCFRKLNLLVCWRFPVFLWGLETIWPYYMVGRTVP